MLNQIPGDKESTRGHNIRGVYWTKPDETGKEVKRDLDINESLNIPNSFLILKYLF